MQTLEAITHALRERRKTLGLTQKEMLMRIGMTQQQYQRIESGSDLRVSTLLRILEGMDLDLFLIPGDKREALTAWLNDDETHTSDDHHDRKTGSGWDQLLNDLKD